MKALLNLTLTQVKANLMLAKEMVVNLERVEDDYILWHETFHSITNAIESIEAAISNTELDEDRPF